MTRHEAILKITDYLREHRVDPKTLVGAAFDGDSPMRGALLMLEALGLIKFDDEEAFNIRSSTIPISLPDQTALEALETMHNIADQLLAQLIIAKGSQSVWYPSKQPWWPDFERAVYTMKRLRGGTHDAPQTRNPW